jgi:hypothetical protein
MGYYHIKLEHDADVQKLCTIVFPWGKYKHKYKYKHLHMVIKIVLSLMFFKTSCLSFQGMEYVENNLDDLLILKNRNNSFKDHLLKLEMVLARFSTAGMRVNIFKS